MLSPDELRQAIQGPVFPIPTPFTADYAIDYEALADYVDFLVEAGAQTILVTVGTSRFNLLTPEEMMAVNETVVKTVSGRAVAIAAAPIQASLSQNLQFAHQAETIGADGIMVMYPERYYGDDPVYDFYQAIASAVNLGVMIHEMPMRSGFTGAPVQFSLDLLERLTDLPGLAGLKEECGNGEYAYSLLRRFSDKTAIIGAGSMHRFLRDYHAGATAYLVGIGNFLPKLAIAFYNAVMQADFDTAHQITRNNEDPYFQFAVSLGWHRALKESLALMNLMPPHERPPMNRINDAQRAGLHQVMQQCGWL